MNSKDKTISISLSIKQSLYDKIKELADQDRRSFSAMVNLVLDDYVKFKGGK